MVFVVISVVVVCVFSCGGGDKQNDQQVCSQLVMGQVVRKSIFGALFWTNGETSAP